MHTLTACRGFSVHELVIDFTHNLMYPTQLAVCMRECLKNGDNMQFIVILVLTIKFKLYKIERQKHEKPMGQNML